MKNEGIIERSIQIAISAILFLGAFFWVSGIWQVGLLIGAMAIGVFAIIGFCPLYVLIGKESLYSVKKITKGKFLFLFVYTFILLSAGAYGSVFLTKKIFVEDFNAMNKDYKQTLFETGQGKRMESKENYDKLVVSYAIFENKYLVYHPYSLRGDVSFDADLKKIEEIILGAKDGVYNGDLKAMHLEFEKVRPITQDILKRNGFSMLAITLVDFHDSMEKVLDGANAKDAAKVIATYDEANNKLLAVEQEANDVEIQVIRKNLDEILQLAKDGKSDQLPTMAGELKKNFVKVYLIRG
ncbi:MAG: hypothetical protein UR66_C0004G0031 [Candidatus Moranbacteria bacterium GW2011_GWE1_35_17]|nr:MAG: hypothetical protein UR66_C0004G0031 [Candidatus Moranbacteria bacterium GW2011_GWE1_35_17]KKP73842.1 MAG: hypothetical protein UR65_C0002G0006 [Candidatus Moranbacteria bacterium GW2011_GWE2_35_164]KKP80638.1 MAG: hypothetical protein UR82_C0087G0005 [Candidatus Moranbacteria bacterium GW2011_GWF1_35_5]KKP85124.1 MAG: hypothetical protein UR83_C0004G0012 [Candidatus Moranbacteria bacterium GW2011_GWF2_35_54]